LDVDQERSNEDEDDEDDEDGGHPIELEETGNIFHFIGIQSLGGRTWAIYCFKPKLLYQSCALDEEDDQRVEDVDKTAERVIGQDQKLYDRWKQIFGQNESFNMDVDGKPAVEKQNPYTPFTSELDWRIARWAVKNNPGHKVFDQLLSIPRVSLAFQMNIIYY
jgi:hypothetical protein